MMSQIDSKQLRELVRKLERKLGILEDGEFSCCGVSLAQCHALIEIGRAKSISLIDLAGLINLDNSTMSRTVNNLVSGELVEREIDPGDRRYVRINLTENGEKLFNTIESNMELYFSKIYGSIPAEKRFQVLESLQILMDAINGSECCKES
jgi:DNA-binding MarR family transcriptional regulator